MAEQEKWSEHLLARAVALQVLNRKCLVLVDNCIWTGHECDVLGVTRDLRIIDVEIKISRADLKADAKKEKWWHRQYLGQGPRTELHNASGKLIGIHSPPIYDSQPRVWPPKVWKHYYCFPKDLWVPELANHLPSQESGVLLFYRQRNSHTPIAMTVERSAKPNKQAEKITPADAIDIARLANLRMWEAYNRLEAMKTKPQTKQPEELT